MIRIRGQSYTLHELAARLRRMPIEGVARNAADVARRPLRRLQVAYQPVITSPAILSRRLGFRSAPAMVEHFREDAFAAFLNNPARRKALADAIVAAHPDAVAEAVARADAVVRHEFDLLGSGRVQLGERIDWSCDFKTGARWEREYYEHLDYCDWNRPSDVKVPWELSRSHHFADLARAFLLTGDQRYVDEASAQWLSWLEENTLGYSVNWACTMDVAIRAVNWIWALSVVAPEVPTAVLARVVGSLHQHGAFIAANLERSEVNGNHYIADAVGLVAVGALFLPWAGARTWMRRGAAILVDELPRQVYPDGVDHEMSIPYHRLVAELFLTGFLILRAAGTEVSVATWERLRQMGIFTVAYTRPDGSAPVWGDADDGRLQRFGPSAVNDHRHLLSTMAVVFRDPALRTAAHDLHEDTQWLLGPEAADEFLHLDDGAVQEPAVSFPDGGFAVLRSNRAHLLFDAGPVGLQGRGGHGHNDALAFELWVDGAPLIVDPGAYVYTADPAARNRFRSTAAHNSPMLDSREMADLGDERHLWTIADHAKASLDECGVQGATPFAAGHHQGYTRLVSGALVHRRIELFDRGLHVVDDVNVTGDEWRVHLTFHPAVKIIEVASPGRAVLARGGQDYILTFRGASVVEAIRADYSPSYGVRQPTVGIRARFPGPRLETEVAFPSTGDGIS